MLYKNFSQVGQKNECATHAVKTRLCSYVGPRCEPPGLVVGRPNDTARVFVPCQTHATMYVGPNAAPSISQDNLLLTHEGHNI